MLGQISKRVGRMIPALDNLVRQRETSVPVPPPEFRSLVSGDPTTSEEDHTKIGRALFEMIKAGCDLKPSSAVLDIGCGCGRIATHMGSYLTKGTYHGVDIVKPMVDWCATEITSRYPNFHFHHADLRNTLYSANGRTADSYVFPFPDGMFDVIFATSVFTHLVPDSARQYLNETARMLKPRMGLALLSFFLLSENRPRRTMNGKLYQCDGFNVIDKANPEHVVVYEESIARQMIEAAGLKIKRFDCSAPSDNPEDWSTQDIFVVSV